MKSSRRLIIAAVIGLGFCAFGQASNRFAVAGGTSDAKGAATTKPAIEATRTPAEQLSAWQDDFDRWTPDQAMSAFAVHNDVEKAMAKAMALNGVVSQRLIRLARERWGEKAEIAVAHACGTDARADDATARTEVNGDHATIVFHSDDFTDLSLVREHGAWKIDVGAYVTLAGGREAAITRAIDQSTQVVDQAQTDVNAGKYSSADELAKYVREKIAALVPQ